MSLPKIKAAKESVSDVDLGKREAKVSFATYKSRDRDGDRANQGMFNKSWQEFKDVRLFKNHDKNIAPGKILKMWDDPSHAYGHLKLGTHTEGDDVLKQMSEGIISDTSYMFYALKADPLPGGGQDLREVFHKEISVLTHWGAHPGSKVMAVQKSAEAFGPEVLKQLSTEEVVFLRDYISHLNSNLSSLVDFGTGLQEGSDVYSWVNSVIGDLTYTISRFKDRLVWGQKEWTENELKERLHKLKSFCNNTTASDECIQNILKEADGIESLLTDYNSTLAAEQALKQPTIKNEAEVELQLQSLKMLLSNGHYTNS
jgi:HK97 family phage prohead protease